MKISELLEPTLTGLVVKIKRKDGKKANGNTWTLTTFKVSDGVDSVHIYAWDDLGHTVEANKEYTFTDLEWTAHHDKLQLQITKDTEILPVQHVMQ